MRFGSRVPRSSNVTYMDTPWVARNPNTPTTWTNTNHRYMRKILPEERFGILTGGGRKPARSTCGVARRARGVVRFGLLPGPPTVVTIGGAPSVRPGRRRGSPQRDGGQHLEGGQTEGHQHVPL